MVIILHILSILNFTRGFYATLEYRIYPCIIRTFLFWNDLQNPVRIIHGALHFERNEICIISAMILVFNNKNNSRWNNLSNYKSNIYV